MNTRALATLLIFAAGCSPAPPPAAPPAPPTSKTEYRPPAKKHLTYKTPPEWISEEVTGNMRLAQYRIPSRTGKGDPASLTFFSMGGQSVETMTDYWRNKMGGADASVTKVKDAASPTTLVDIVGEYSDVNPPLADARFLGAMIEVGERTWYLKFVGPAETVAGWKDAFIEMLKGVRPIE